MIVFHRMGSSNTVEGGRLSANNGGQQGDDHRNDGEDDDV